MKYTTVEKFFQFLEKKEDKTPPKIISINADPDPFPGFEKVKFSKYVSKRALKPSDIPSLNKNSQLIIEELKELISVSNLQYEAVRSVNPDGKVKDTEEVIVSTERGPIRINVTRNSIETQEKETIQFLSSNYRSTVALACRLALGMEKEIEEEWDKEERGSGGWIKDFYIHKKQSINIPFARTLETLMSDFNFKIVSNKEISERSEYLEYIESSNLLKLQDAFGNVAEMVIGINGLVRSLSVNSKNYTGSLSKINPRILKRFLKGYSPSKEIAREKLIPASQVVRNPSSPIVSFTYGRISRSGRGKEGTWPEIAPHLTDITYDNVENVGKKLGIKWEKAYIYNLQDEAMVAVFGKDKKGREFMFDKYGAGQSGYTALRLGSRRINVSSILAMKNSPFEEN